MADEEAGRTLDDGSGRAASQSEETDAAASSQRAKPWRATLPIGLLVFAVAAALVWFLVDSIGSERDPAGDGAEQADGSGVADDAPDVVVTPSGPDEAGRAARLVPEIIAEHPHDATAFTQGLLLHDGLLYESTGLRGRSSLREVELTTGNIRRAERLDDSFFGEGLALAGESFWQLTWQSGVAIRYDRASFGRIEIVRYEGEGWGLCHDGERLIMSDGSGSLFFRDPDTFALEGEIAVTVNGEPTERLNELECVGSLVYANVWQTNNILEIDPGTGVAAAVIDASALTARAVELATADMDVLNGIAWDPADGDFYVTGKLWPVIFEVDFRPAGPESNPDAGGAADG